VGKGAQTISQSLPLPMYAGMEETLRRRIADSTYPLGSSLPSESSLAEEFRVSRFTAREALRRLGEAGLIQSQQGARSRVIGRHPHGAYTFSVSSAEDIQQYARETHLVSTSVRALEARGALARFLRCRDKREWLLLTGTRIESKTGTVVGHTKVYLWAEFEPHITEVTKRGRPIHRQIETKLGVHTSNIRQEITAIPMRGRGPFLPGRFARPRNRASLLW
jgi:DNA-binding GntR family transcriptional regulator